MTKPSIVPSIISILELIAFALLALSFVFSVGICCGDDAYHAVIAKNLADGLGYTSTIQAKRTDFIALPFDPIVGVGPTIILPASLAIKFFGNSYWAPGLAHVMLWSLLCVGIGSLIRKYHSEIGLPLATLSFFYLGYTLFTFHYEQWFALLGEIPAALLIILAVLLFFHKSDSRLRQFFAGIAFSLAVQAKLLSLLAFATFLFVLAIFHASDKSESAPGRSREFFSQVFYLCVGFIVPFVIFETWKYFKLGLTVYIERWRDYLSFIDEQGIKGQMLTLIKLYKMRAGTIYERFGITLPSVTFLIVLVGVLVNKNEDVRRLYFVFVSMIVSYSFWWVFFSIGWPRYYIIALILIIAVASLPFLSLHPRKWMLLYLVLLIAWPAHTWDHIKFPFSQFDAQYFKPTKRTEALLQASNILFQSRVKERILTQWWATAADLEYIMNENLAFTTYRDETQKSAHPYWIGANSKFLNKSDKDFIDLLNRCKNLRDINGYLVGRCE